MKVVNGWAQFTYEEAMGWMCGAEHIWHIYDDGMPCMCGKFVLGYLGDGTLWKWPTRGTKDAPNAAHRFGPLSHFIEGECGCHPPESPSTASSPNQPSRLPETPK